MCPLIFQIPALHDLLTHLILETAVLLLRQIPLPVALWIICHLDYLAASFFLSGALLLLSSQDSSPD